MKEWGKGQSRDHKQTAVNHLFESGSKMSTVRVGKGTRQAAPPQLHLGAGSTPPPPAPYVGRYTQESSGLPEILSLWENQKPEVFEQFPGLFKY